LVHWPTKRLDLAGDLIASQSDGNPNHPEYFCNLGSCFEAQNSWMTPVNAFDSRSAGSKSCPWFDHYETCGKSRGDATKRY